MATLSTPVEISNVRFKYVEDQDASNDEFFPEYGKDNETKYAYGIKYKLHDNGNSKIRKVRILSHNSITSTTTAFAQLLTAVDHQGMSITKNINLYQLQAKSQSFATLINLNMLVLLLDGPINNKEYRKLFPPAYLGNVRSFDGLPMTNWVAELQANAGKEAEAVLLRIRGCRIQVSIYKKGRVLYTGQNMQDIKKLNAYLNQMLYDVAFFQHKEQLDPLHKLVLNYDLKYKDMTSISKTVEEFVKTLKHRESLKAAYVEELPSY